MANRHMKTYSTSLLMRESKLKPQSDIISHLSEWPSSTNQQRTNAGEDVETREPFALLVGMQTDAATVESTVKLPQKIRHVTALCNSTSGNIYEET